MEVIQAPHDYYACPRPFLFLSGSIEMGAAEHWQERMIRALCSLPGTILNPRRDDWDNTWKQSVDDERFAEQVEWELVAIKNADVQVVYFAKDTKAPITLLELGFMYMQPHVIVCCPDGFYRRGNVEIFCTRNNHDGLIFTDDWGECLSLVTQHVRDTVP